MPPNSGEGADTFAFALSEEEFLDILFEDLELPDLVKASLKDLTNKEPRRRRLFERRHDPQSQCPQDDALQHEPAARPAPAEFE